MILLFHHTYRKGSSGKQGTSSEASIQQPHDASSLATSMGTEVIHDSSSDRHSRRFSNFLDISILHEGFHR